MTVGGATFVRAVLSVALTVLALTLGWTTAAEASFPGTAGKIAFGGGSTPGDIFVMNADGSGLVNITATDDLGEVAPEWSPDGQRLLFTRERDQTWMTDANGTVATPLPILGARHASWSPDGQKVVFVRFAGASICSSIHTANLDGTDERLVLAASAGPCVKELPAWSPAGGLITFGGGTTSFTGIYTVRTDGSNMSGAIAAGRAPEWSPAGHRIMYDAPASNNVGFEIHTVNPDGSGDLPLNPSAGVEGEDGAWSPDGTRVVFSGFNGLRIADDAGGNPSQITFHWDYQPDWQPLPPLPPADPGYPRPRGATPLRVALVPAYRPCTNPNRTHGPPLAFGSCAPPRQTSDALTVGTPDANGEPAASIGKVRFRTVAGDPATDADEADVLVDATLTDVRCRLALPGYCTGGALSEYVGGLELVPVIRITDRHSGGAERDPATGFDLLSFSLPIPCTGTPSTPAGATCDTQTSLDALAPGTIQEGKRAIWALSEIAVRDAGIDDPRVDAYTTFAVQGVFVP